MVNETYDPEMSLTDLTEDMLPPPVEEVPEEPPEVLPIDLQAVVDGEKLSPQERAKMTRGYYAHQGWPSPEHPGTVRDFLVAHNIPIVDTPRNPVLDVHEEEK